MSSACSPSDPGPGPRKGQLQLQASSLSGPMRPRVDLDGNGIVDHRDVRAFEDRHQLPHTLSERLAATLGR